MEILIVVVYLIIKTIWILALMAGYREVSDVKSVSLNITYLIACITYIASTANAGFDNIVQQPLKILALGALIVIAYVSLTLNKHYRSKYEKYEDTPTIILRKIISLVKAYKEPKKVDKDDNI